MQGSGDDAASIDLGDTSGSERSASDSEDGGDNDGDDDGEAVVGGRKAARALDSDCSSESGDDDTGQHQKEMERIRRTEFVASIRVKESASYTFDEFSHSASHVIVQNRSRCTYLVLSNIHKRAGPSASLSNQAEQSRKAANRQPGDVPPLVRKPPARCGRVSAPIRS